MTTQQKTFFTGKVLLFVFPLFLISCIEIRDPKKQVKSPAVEAAPAALPIAEVRPLDLPHQYAVVIKGVQPMSQVMRKPISLLVEMPMAAVPVSSSQAEDVVDQPGEYLYLVQQDGATTNLKVRIPEDYVIEGDMKLDQLSLNITTDQDHFRAYATDGRIFFKAGSTLTTNGENLLIKATSIESEGAMIQTFPANLKATDGMAGRHGGDIKLEAQSLRGTLQFFMRGENGGNGETLHSGTHKSIQQLNNNGQKGGNSGQLELAIVDQSRGGVNFELIPGAGGEGSVVAIYGCPTGQCGTIVIKTKGENAKGGVAQQPIGIK